MQKDALVNLYLCPTLEKDKTCNQQIRSLPISFGHTVQLLGQMIQLRPTEDHPHRRE